MSDLFSLILIVLKGNFPSDISTHGAVNRSLITAMLLAPAFSFLCLCLSHVAIVLVLRSHFDLLFFIFQMVQFFVFSLRKRTKNKNNCLRGFPLSNIINSITLIKNKESCRHLVILVIPISPSDQTNSFSPAAVLGPE